MTYYYTIRDQRVPIRANCWALHYEEGHARECRVVDPQADPTGRIVVETRGEQRRVHVDRLVVPPRPLPFAPAPEQILDWITSRPAG